MAKKQKMSAKQKQARVEAAAAREAAALEAKQRKEFWKRIGIAVVAILLIAGLMVPSMAVSFCGNQRVEQAAQQTSTESSAAQDTATSSAEATSSAQ